LLSKTTSVQKELVNEMPVVDIEHDCNNLVVLFEKIFLLSHGTRLLGGGEEPEYIPAAGLNSEHTIIFTRNYFASALHEIAHWCIAGEQRRQLPDYGYWYAPDGRTAEQQKKFEQVEAKPQALEWFFSRACGSVFRLSVDNLNGDVGVTESFKESVLREAKGYCLKGNSASDESRAVMFAKALVNDYRAPFYFSPDAFLLRHLN
jgi:elongation factor P hydroxylase